MSDQYEQFAKRMEERFPKMFEGRYGGFACGEGWWPMLETLCGVIQNHIDQVNERRERLLVNNEFNHPIPEQIAQVTIEQIKEKFGTLRFYYQGGDEFIHGAVWLAESMSGQICESCGNPGERRGGGWVHTYCQPCETKREIERAKIMKEEGYEE